MLKRRSHVDYWEPVDMASSLKRSSKSEVIEAVLWRLTLIHRDIFVADTTMAEMVLGRKQKTRYYFDPMNGRVHTILSTSVPKSKPIELIDDISAVADLKTGWNCKSWLCVEPLHYTQTDSYNCGVIVCLFARCLCEGLDINGSYDVDIKRERITSVIFGSCYDDLDWRNTAVCKICKDDDGEDWLGCDSCGQFFHASCLDVPFAETLTQHFTCP